MALSRSAARTARYRRWLWALSACGGAASLVLVEGQIQESAREHGQTAAEYAKDRAIVAADNLKKTTGVAGALLRTAMTSALAAMQQRSFDPGDFRADLAATVADLASDTPTRRHLIALGGGYFLDWLLQLAYPQQLIDAAPSSAPGRDYEERSGSSKDDDSVHAGGGGTAGISSSNSSSGEGVRGPGLALALGQEATGLWHGLPGLAGGSGGGGAFGGAPLPSWGPPELGDGTGAPTDAEGEGSKLPPPSPSPSPPQKDARGTTGVRPLTASESRSSEPPAAAAAAATAAMATAATAAAAARMRREAERALESILRDDVAAGMLLDRRGAVPRLLRAVADGRASSDVEAALAKRAAEARVAAEAMTADLREALEALRGVAGGGKSGGGGGLALQCIAAGLLCAWAVGSSSNRAKLTGLGLQGTLAEVATAVSGLNDRAAVGLQWQLLRLARVMAEHSSPRDAHHLATCVLPLLYTAADAAAAGDATMASYAVDTLAAAVRYGGAAVAAVVSSSGSTMPHLLWQLAEGLGAQRVLAAAPPQADGTGSAAGACAGQRDIKLATAGSPPPPAAVATAKPPTTPRSWFSWGRGGSTSAPAGQLASPGSAAGTGAAGAAAGSSSNGAPAVQTVKGWKVMQIQNQAVTASVAAAVAELARSSLLPEAQLARWRDWLLDVLCADGFDPGTSSSGIGTGTAETVAVPAGRSCVDAPLAPAPAGPQGLGQHANAKVNAAPRPQLRGETPLAAAAGAVTGGGCSSSVGSGGSTAVGRGDRRRQRTPVPLPGWLTLPEGVWRGHETSGSSSRGGGGGVDGIGICSAAPGMAREPEMGDLRSAENMRTSVVAALSVLSHMPGNHGLQAAHYWLARLLSELAARTLPYTSLVYLEGPRAPQDLIHAVPVLPSYVRSVADALERAADAVADDSPPLPPHLEFDLAGSGLVARPTHDTQPRRAGAGGTASSSSTTTNKNGGSGSSKKWEAAATGAVGGSSSELLLQQQQQQQHQVDVEAYRQAAHVVDVVMAERKAADALEALCAIVAPDLDKQRWLLRRGVLPLLHRLTCTADDPWIVLQEQDQRGAERLEQEVSVVRMEAAGAANGRAAADAAAATNVNAARSPHHPPHGPSQRPAQAVRPATGGQQIPHHHHPQQQQHAHSHHHYNHHHHHPQQQQQQQQGHQLLDPQRDTQQPGQAEVQVVVSELLSDHAGGPSLCLQRQVARMLALLALLPDASNALAGGNGGSSAAAAAAMAALVTAAASNADIDGGNDGWLPWLRHAASSNDCRLSSNATRALLHLAALGANAAAAAVAVASLPLASSGAGGAAATPAAISNSTPPLLPPVFLDGIHLLDPGAQHHWALVRQAMAASATAVAAAGAGAGGGVTAAAAASMPFGGLGSDAADERVRTAELSLVPMDPRASVAAVTASTAAAELAEELEEPQVTFSPVGSPAATVTKGCGPASSDDIGSALATQYGTLTAPSVVAPLLGVLQCTVSRSWSWSPWVATIRADPSLAVAASHGGNTDPPLPLPLPAVAAATAAEPLQAAPHAVTAVTESSLPHPPRPPPRHSGYPSAVTGMGEPAPAVERRLPSLAALSDPPLPKGPGSGTAVCASSSSRGGGNSGALIPSAAIPPYPAPYTDTNDGGAVSTPGISSNQSVPLPYAGAGNAATSASAAISTDAEAAASPPQVDVVFVHGIRGGPFITWRRAGVMTRGSAASHMERSACWPSTWLAEDLPGARLLSVEYLAPVSAWEGESLPLEDNVSRVMGQLAAAGVGTGQRPVVFVAHSMGGLLVKEMLARSMDQASEGGPHASLAPSTRGIVFFGTPHFGNGIAAMGWKLRHVPGALPAPSLARLTPGPHLLSLNDRLRQLHEAQGGALRVVSMMEGQATQLSGVIPRILIVAPDSAYPGFGAAMMLPENDHIDCCKPAGRTAPAYRVVRDLVLHAMRASGG